MRSASFLQFIKFLHMPCALWQRHISICFLVCINISWSLDIVSWHLIWRSGHFLCIIYSRECWGSVLVLMSGWIHWFARSLDAEAETPILWPSDVESWLHLKRPWCWERLRAGGEEDDREWDGWMASLTWWTWVCASFRSRWCTGKPGVLQSTGSQRVRHNWETELSWTEALPK